MFVGGGAVTYCTSARCVHRLSWPIRLCIDSSLPPGPLTPFLHHPASCHYLSDPALSGAVQRFLGRERAQVEYTMQVGVGGGGGWAEKGSGWSVGDWWLQWCVPAELGILEGTGTSLQGPSALQAWRPLSSPGGRVPHIKHLLPSASPTPS